MGEDTFTGDYSAEALKALADALHQLGQEHRKLEARGAEATAADLRALLAEEDYQPIGGPALPGWRLYRQQPPRHRSPEYVAVSDTDGSAQVVAFVADRADLFALLTKWGNL